MPNKPEPKPEKYFHIQMRSKIDKNFWWRGGGIAQKDIKKELEIVKIIFGEHWEASLIEVTIQETKDEPMQEKETKKKAAKKK